MELEIIIDPEETQAEAEADFLRGPQGIKGDKRRQTETSGDRRRHRPTRNKRSTRHTRGKTEMRLHTMILQQNN